MVELSDAGGGLLRRGFAGDTFNMAWYARAILPAAWTVGYVSAVGDDALSAEMLAFMRQSGVDTDAVRIIPARSPGLYLITLKNGERSFTYWRDTSAARQLADDPAHLARHFDGADAIHFSGITLGILTPTATDTLLVALQAARRAGARVSFDTNFRPRLWQGRTDAAEMFLAAARVASIVLPGLDDEAAVFGPCTPEQVADRYRSAGSEIIAVKDGARGAMLFTPDSAEHIAAVAPPEVVDTTAAGDSFAAAFLSRLLTGSSPQNAASFAARVASSVVGQRGALVALPAALLASQPG